MSEERLNELFSIVNEGYSSIEEQEIRDYITNLQEENERLKELCDKYEEEHNNEFQCWKRDRKELLDKRARIDKAIEYIKEHIKYECDAVFSGMSFYSYHLYDFKKEDLLNILGGDKE